MDKLCYKVGIQWTIVQIEWNYILGPAFFPPVVRVEVKHFTAVEF